MLIPGGSGLIGRALAPALAAKGHSVVILSRRPEKLGDLGGGISAEGWDGRTSLGWGPLADGDVAIVNLAGENLASGRWTASRKRRLRESRIDASRAVAEAVRKARRPPRLLLQGSAVGYYGARGDEVVDESAAPGNDFLARLCVAWEEASKPVEAAGVRRVLLRTGLVLSGEGGALPRMLPPFRWFVGGRLGSGRQWMPWIHAADLVAAVCFLLCREDCAGPYDLTAPQPVTNREFTFALGRAMGRPAVLPAPAFALRVALGEMADLLLTGQRVLPARLRAAGFEFRFPDLDAALADLLE